MWGLKEEKIMDRRKKVVFSLLGRTGIIDTQYILHKWYESRRGTIWEEEEVREAGIVMEK